MPEISIYWKKSIPFSWSSTHGQFIAQLHASVNFLRLGMAYRIHKCYLLEHTITIRLTESVEVALVVVSRKKMLSKIMLRQYCPVGRKIL